jgi:FtsP/CotA-like multicopper oxidase with cupredoxin domain
VSVPDNTAADAGTYWYHSHGDLQRGRGLYGALIVDDPAEAGGYDVEFTVVLSDWLTDQTPQQVFDQLRHSGMGSMNGMSGMSSPLLGGDAGDVRYPVYLMGGRPPSAPITLSARPGQRARIRLINAGDDTAFRVALGGHQLRVTHSDGRAVSPTRGDAVLITMGERYDVLVTLADGVFPLVADAEGKNGRAFGLVRTSAGTAPSSNVTPAQLSGRVLTVADLSAAESDRLPVTAPDVTLTGVLGGGMAHYDWTINGRAYPASPALPVHQGQRVRLTYTNNTTMYHPMHLHGHTFAVARPDGTGPRKDTVAVLPGHSVGLDFDTDNPGQWFTHCHNEYHLAAGMATLVSYRT